MGHAFHTHCTTSPYKNAKKYLKRIIREGYTDLTNVARGESQAVLGLVEIPGWLPSNEGLGVKMPLQEQGFLL